MASRRVASSRFDVIRERIGGREYDPIFLLFSFSPCFTVSARSRESIPPGSRSQHFHVYLFFFFLRFRGSRNLLAFFSFFLSFFLAKERGKRETSVGRVETSRMFRRTRGLLERVGGVRRVGRAKCKGARGRESPWRYYVQVHFDVNRFGKLVKISVAAGGYGEDGKAEGGGWRGGAAGGAGDGVRKLFRRVHFLSA